MTDPTGKSLPAEESPPTRRVDRVAFWKFAEHVRPYLLRVAERILGDNLTAKTDASSVVQRSFLAAHAKLCHLDKQDENVWRNWLLAIVRNKARSMHRLYGQERRDAGRERELHGGVDGSQIHPPLAASESSPSDCAMRRERAELLAAAIDRLPVDYRQIIELRNFRFTGFGEIARLMDRSEDAARQLWVRAIDRLRHELGGKE
jgi:RNA polymerase sigma-70 factor (ECF subfamily)